MCMHICYTLLTLKYVHVCTLHAGVHVTMCVCVSRRKVVLGIMDVAVIVAHSSHQLARVSWPKVAEQLGLLSEGIPAIMIATGSEASRTVTLMNILQQNSKSR